MTRDHHILLEVAKSVVHFDERYQQAMERGNVERADEARSVLDEIRRDVTVHENSTRWRRTIDAILRRERRR